MRHRMEHFVRVVLYFVWITGLDVRLVKIQHGFGVVLVWFV